MHQLRRISLGAVPKELRLNVPTSAFAVSGFVRVGREVCPERQEALIDSDEGRDAALQLIARLQEENARHVERARIGTVNALREIDEREALIERLEAQLAESRAACADAVAAERERIAAFIPMLAFEFEGGQRPMLVLDVAANAIRRKEHLRSRSTQKEEKTP
jgi:hypothetical protein